MVDDLRGKRMYDNLVAMGADLIPCHPIAPAGYPAWVAMKFNAIRRLKTAVVIEASNVAKYFYEGTDQERWDFFKDFPVTMAPFENTWIEFSIPKMSHSRAHGNVPNPILGLCDKVGVLVNTVNLDEMDSSFRKLIENNGFIFEGCKYAQEATLFINVRGVVRGPLMSIIFGLDELGKPTSTTNRTFLMTPASSILSPDKLNGHQCLAQAAFLTLVFLNCRNTVVIDRKPEEKLSKVHEKKTGNPLVTYKVLEIEPIKKIFAKNTQPGESIQKALHICRGHFKDFRESGLFGKFKGIYWWNHQVRGTSERGEILRNGVLIYTDKSFDRPFFCQGTSSHGRGAVGVRPSWDDYFMGML